MCADCANPTAECPMLKQALDELHGHNLAERVTVLERETRELWESIRNLRGV